MRNDLNMSKLTRVNLQELAHLRLAEARLLLDGKSFAGAYYLTGLALECALKACIARSCEQYDFPELVFEGKMLLGCFTYSFSLQMGVGSVRCTSMKMRNR